MRRIVTLVGYIAIILIIFGGGYFLGTIQSKVEHDQLEAEREKISNEQKITDTKAQAEADVIAKDIFNVSTKYEQLYNLCEEKYQTGIQGDLSTAIRINGQMDAIKTEIDNTLYKYNSDYFGADDYVIK